MTLTALSHFRLKAAAARQEDDHFQDSTKDGALLPFETYKRPALVFSGARCGREAPTGNEEKVDVLSEAVSAVRKKHVVL